MRVVSADAAFFHTDMDEIVVNGGITNDAVFASALARCAVSCFGQQRGFTWIDSPRRKRDERVTQIINRLLVLRGDKVCPDGEPEDQHESEIHVRDFKLERPGRQSDLAF